MASIPSTPPPVDSSYTPPPAGGAGDEAADPSIHKTRRGRGTGSLRAYALAVGETAAPVAERTVAKDLHGSAKKTCEAATALTQKPAAKATTDRFTRRELNLSKSASSSTPIGWTEPDEYEGLSPERRACHVWADKDTRNARAHQDFREAFIGVERAPTKEERARAEKELQFARGYLEITRVDVAKARENYERLPHGAHTRKSCDFLMPDSVAYCSDAPHSDRPFMPRCGTKEAEIGAFHQIMAAEEAGATKRYGAGYTSCGESFVAVQKVAGRILVEIGKTDKFVSILSEPGCCSPLEQHRIKSALGIRETPRPLLLPERTLAEKTLDRLKAFSAHFTPSPPHHETAIPLAKQRVMESEAALFRMIRGKGLHADDEVRAVATYVIAGRAEAQDPKGPISPEGMALSRGLWKNCRTDNFSQKMIGVDDKLARKVMMELYTCGTFMDGFEPTARREIAAEVAKAFKELPHSRFVDQYREEVRRDAAYWRSR